MTQIEQKKRNGMSDYKPITGELRKYATVAWDPWPDARDRLYQMCDRIDSIHAGLEREYAATLAEREGDWIKLPVDADGLPIHVGDVMVYAETGLCPKKVKAIVSSAVFLTDEGPRYADMCRHQPDTWERIIEDAVNVHGNGFNPCWTDERDALVARCKALAGEAE